MERRKKFNCFFEFVSMDDLTFRQKQKKNKGDRDFNLKETMQAVKFVNLLKKLTWDFFVQGISAFSPVIMVVL